MTLVTVSGYPGSGTTSVVRELGGILGIPTHNIGDAFRALARERSMTLAELHIHAKSDRSIDRLLDETQVKRAGEGDVILEGRLAGFLTRRGGLNGTRVWLQASFAVRAKRVATREGVSPAAAEEEIRVRQGAERTRYIEYYGFDLD
ncbi:MAG: (d)CMP kinase, partial [Planctomycetota bacterium]